VRYEVDVASLPTDIAANICARVSPATPPPAQHRLPLGPDFRLALVQPIADAGPPGSPARAEKLREVAARAVFPSGKKAGKPVGISSLRAWLADYDAKGAVPLMRRKPRADKGAARVIAWREWDRAMAAAGVPEAEQRKMVATMHAKVLGCWAAGEASAANIQFIMTPELRALADAAGLALPEADMARLCRMPLHFAGRKDRRRARMANIKRNDAAGWAANNTPRVRRHRDGMRPMDQLAADVRHSDILYRRPDGSLATAKIVCFLDLATNRLFTRPFLLPKGEMIRREHVLTALRDLADDPAWGLWRGLYMDNGGEFKAGLAADDLPHLVGLVRQMHGEASADGCGNITSRPYNPQSKVIEGAFSILTRSVEPVYAGYIGGNRMAKKTQNQGRAPEPMQGDEAAIIACFQEQIALYNAKSQGKKSHLKGRSPDEAFAAACAEGWRAIVMDPGEFSLCFGPDEWRVVQPGGELQIAGRAFHDHGRKLTTMVGERVRVRLPILAPDRVVVLTDKDEPLLVAEVVPVFAFNDREGAKAHSRGRRGAAMAAKDTARGAAKVNLPAMRNAAVAALPKVAPPAPAAVATLHPVLREAAETCPVAPVPHRRQAEEKRRADEAFAAQQALAEAYRRAG